MWKLLALAALALASGCSAWRYEPPADWLAEGGRLCAQARESLFESPAAPSPCEQALNAPPSADI